MLEVLIPCHACGSDNPATATRCNNDECEAVLRFHLRPTTATQVISLISNAEEGPEKELLREAFINLVLLHQAAYRYKALIDAKVTETASE